ncbi:hypothetical protein DSCO28_31290 [Desulfosarcina ovata subsp. sediminis]|uniref:ABC transporter domain-containing protein n=1 Tax=Desulfosarcina ovata subsp. sediminis TaxID=885957 RepID=A0A5K7ZRR7_9BACT|nr:ATP-binding cassette domain-containing protein [Desulfosarcina ovata]BBO82563.1 hypothetical protein DSCO28_31290 [Desulfosarcina ovata subsp. sediminis]
MEEVLKKIGLRIPENALTALVGPSESGKTTLTRLIARFWDVDAGEICIGERNIKDYPTDHLLDNLSMVFQDVYLFNDTIFNNIRIGRDPMRLGRRSWSSTRAPSRKKAPTRR